MFSKPFYWKIIHLPLGWSLLGRAELGKKNSTKSPDMNAKLHAPDMNAKSPDMNAKILALSSTKIIYKMLGIATLKIKSRTKLEISCALISNYTTELHLKALSLLLKKPYLVTSGGFPRSRALDWDSCALEWFIVVSPQCSQQKGSKGSRKGLGKAGRQGVCWLEASLLRLSPQRALVCELHQS